MPRVTVAIPTYNNAETLERAVRSVANQTYQDYEIIVLDDGSVDDTEKVVEKLLNELSSEIRYKKHLTNKGRSAARNGCIQFSKSKYLAWLDADDEWLPTKLEEQINLLDQLDDTYQAILCGYIHIQPNERSRHIIPNPKQTPWELYCLENFDLALGITQLASIEAFEVVGPYDINLNRGEDQDWMLRFLDHYSLAVVPKPLAIYYNLSRPEITQLESATKLFIEKNITYYQNFGWRGERALSKKWLYLARLYKSDELNSSKALYYFWKTYLAYPIQSLKTAMLFGTVVVRKIYESVVNFVYRFNRTGKDK
jgi:glycosyltransferase involved in cell wall biosynthesis